MLSLSSYPFSTPFRPTQHDGVRFQQQENGHYSNWLTPEEKPLTACTTPDSEDSLRQPNGSVTAKHVTFVDNEGRNPCNGFKTPMNGVSDIVMTGSTNGRSEQLSWLADVATGIVSATQNSSPSSPGREKDPPQLMHNSECLPPRSSLNSILLGANPANQRMYGPYHPERFHPAHPTTVSGGTRMYYSQAPRTAPYPNFYHNEQRLSYGQAVADGLLSPGRISHPYYQSELYTAAMTSIHPPSPLGALPHSPSYLHSTARMSPVGASTSPSMQARMSQQPGTILVSHTPEGIVVHEEDKSNIVIRGSSPQYHRDDRKKSYKSPDPENQSSVDLPTTFIGEIPCKEVLRQNVSPLHLAYKVPTGKEGSLKHRILRPPSINIVDPPPTMLDAPLSAPPIRSHPELSSKHPRTDNYTPYRSFSTSGAFVLDGPEMPRLPHASSTASFIVPPSPSASSGSSSVRTNSPETGSHHKYPHAFMKGSIIQLANSQLKPVENMTTEDFMECENLSSNLKIDSSCVTSIEKVPISGSAKLGFSVGEKRLKIIVDAPLEHPFFVFKQGWSSCSPKRSLQRYGLTCSKLKVGDTCIFLTVKSGKQTTKSEPSSTVVPTNLQDVKPPAAAISHNTGVTKIMRHPTSSTYDKIVKSEEGRPLKKDFLRTAVKRDTNDKTVSKSRKRRWSDPGEAPQTPLSDS